ncbi:MAG: hypothetical protein WDW36_006736 [Sanguina aurantia]
MFGPPLQKRLTSQLADAERQLAKLNEKLMAAGIKDPSAAARAAALKSELTGTTQTAAAALEHNKALEVLLRSSGKELEKSQMQLQACAGLSDRNGVLANSCKELTVLLEQARAESKTQTQVLRNRENDAARHVAESEAQQQILTTSQEALSSSVASLKLRQQSIAALELELSVVREELTRTASVASRVAASSAKAGE